MSSSPSSSSVKSNFAYIFLITFHTKIKQNVKNGVFSLCIVKFAHLIFKWSNGFTKKDGEKQQPFPFSWSRVIVSLPRETCKLKNTHIIISLAGNCIKDTTTFLSFEIQIAVIFPRFGYFIHAMELHGTSNYGSGVEFLTFSLSTHTIYANKQTNK